MGGVFMIIPFLFFLLIININLGSQKLLLLLITIFGFFIIGFLDDYLSIKNKENTGLKQKTNSSYKVLFQYFFIFIYEKPTTTSLQFNLGNKYRYFHTTNFLILVGISNSVNLTDGLDGLVAGCSSIVFYGLGTEILLKEQQDLIICVSYVIQCLAYV